MFDVVLRHILLYGDNLLEVAVLGAVVYRSLWRRLGGVSSYLVLLVAIDAVIRPVVLYGYGIESRQYYYTYWLSNVGLQLAAFLLVCFFFRSVCAQKQEWWRVLRLALPSVFVLTLLLSSISIWHNYRSLSTSTAFVAELEQYLYFACLVLNTLLFVMLQYVDVADDRLPMLVCGLGLQFAGPAAGMALVVLAGHQTFVSLYVDQFCTLGMLLTWLYAVNRVPRARTVVYEGGGAAERAAA